MGTRRWDLMVALGVVSKIEQELIRAEYESWVYSESGKCRRIKSMSSEEQKVDKSSFEKWYNEYCKSCFSEAENMGYR